MIVLQFSGPLNSSDASASGNYTMVTVPKGKKSKSKVVKISRATYNSANDAVTLMTAKKLVLNPPIKLTINSTSLLDSRDHSLSGNFAVTLNKGGAAVTSAVRLDAVKNPTAHVVDALLAWGVPPRLPSKAGMITRHCPQRDSRHEPEGLRVLYEPGMEPIRQSNSFTRFRQPGLADDPRRCVAC